MAQGVRTVVEPTVRKEGEEEPVAATPRASRNKRALEEAGRKGGEAVRAKYGPDFYRDIGRRGGQSVVKSRGPEYYAAIGQKGGIARRNQLGPDGYSQLGRLGGDAVVQKYGSEYMAEIGKRGGLGGVHGQGEKPAASPETPDTPQKRAERDTE